MKKYSIGIIAITCLIVAGCARQETPDEDVAPVVIETPTTGPVAQTPVGTSIPAATIAAVNVRITLSALAKTRLEAAQEAISVTGTYAGDPKASATAQAGPSGMIDLGKNTQQLAGEGSVVFEDDVIDKNRLALIDGEVQMTINVTSAKKSTPENLLACPFYWDTLANASKEPVQIHCTLATESASQ